MVVLSDVCNYITTKSNANDYQNLSQLTSNGNLYEIAY